MIARRGYQGEHQFVLEDLKNEWSRKLTIEQVQVAFAHLDLLEDGELPEMCKTCKLRSVKDA